MCPSKFEIFLIFPNFLRSKKSYVVWQLVRQLVYQVCDTRYQVSFYLWLIRSVLKYCKVPKHYDQDCSLESFAGELPQEFSDDFKLNILRN